MENLRTSPASAHEEMLSYEEFRNTVLNDYRIAVESREASLMGRREVLTGKAKFGIFGDGKEVAQVAMSKFFKRGDFHAGYYRDQTFMFATGIATITQMFAQLYADPDLKNEPFNAGRQMVNHFATRNVDEEGNWVTLTETKNISSAMAPTASQMPHALGLAFASKLFRNNASLSHLTHLSKNGNEVCFCTIGDASTSEGVFWEVINAAGVLQIPLAVFVWDDGYGISVPKEYQTTKASISAALKGFQQKDSSNGIDIYRVKGWDYAGLCETFEAGIEKIRATHIPAVFHVEELTQPQGHSTSGSHERYKPAERLAWEKEWDDIKKMSEWIIENQIATREEIDDIHLKAKDYVKKCRDEAWNNYLQPIVNKATTAATAIKNAVVHNIDTYNELQKIVQNLQQNKEPLRKDVMNAIHMAMEVCIDSPSLPELRNLYESLLEENKYLYDSHLYNEGNKSALHVLEVKPIIPADAPSINGYEILNKYFDALFNTNPLVVAFGEDLGKIGDVNQGFAGLQEKHGVHRIFDTGIREQSIVGQAIGLSFRGLRPIAEIQYLDYLLFCLQTLSDDVATVHYRTAGQQCYPLIIRTRGHRLEGIWHSGSPMGMIINSLRGMHVCVPRNMVQAVGFYNTILQSNEPALIIESLNGYRLKEKLPENLADICVPLGVPEILREGNDITIVSYGSVLRIIQEAAERLAKLQVSCEIIDVQTLLPFDIHGSILSSLQKTNRILFVDEDVPGGASAYMLQQVMEVQGGYRWLDAAPKTLTAKAHRPAYGSDGDYFSKPNAEDIIESVMNIMKE